ncbi:MAG: hypothetical protein U1A22_00830 [Xanthomonadaceae bacterium]|nr:hypothetical protein [Xanthomonadaceae bacterium]
MTGLGYTEPAARRQLHPARRATGEAQHVEAVMSKGMDQKKSDKKKPTKTLKEKRAAKQEKKK